jgi:hypothetical protein
VARWLAAAEDLRAASANAAEVGGDALRAAMAAHRTATAALVGIVREAARSGGRGLSEPMLDRVRALLQAATVDPALAELLRAGRISEQAAAGEAGEAGLGAPPPQARSPAARKAAGRGADNAARSAADEEAAQAEAEREAQARAERLAELEQRVADAAEEAERLTAAAGQAAAAAADADEQLEDARRTLHRRESEAAAARGAAEDARRAAADAKQELDQLRTQLRRARD